MKVEGAINPVTVDFIKEGIEKSNPTKSSLPADRTEYAWRIIEINPQYRQLYTRVSSAGDRLHFPAGSQAGSAGVFITLAAHIAAMTPGTNIGAAHPVTLQGQMDSIMSEKVTNDAAAFIRSIAEKETTGIYCGRRMRSEEFFLCKKQKRLKIPPLI